MSLQEQQWGQDQQNSGEFIEQLKLTDGENKVRIVSNPITAYIHFCKTLEGKKKKLTCLGRDTCPVCQELKAQTDPIIKQIEEIIGMEFNVINLSSILKDAKTEGNTKLIALCEQFSTLNEERGQKKNVAYAIKRPEDKVKIFEFGATINKSINALAKNKRFGNPTLYDITITRSGNGRNTEYSVLPDEEIEFTANEKAQIASLKSLVDLYNPKTIDEVKGYNLVILNKDAANEEEVPF